MISFLLSSAIVSIFDTTERLISAVSNTVFSSPLNRFYLGVPTHETVCPIKTKSICLVFIDCNAHSVVVALGWMDGTRFDYDCS